MIVRLRALTLGASNGPDLVDRHVEIAGPANDVRQGHLGRGVTAIPGRSVDLAGRRRPTSS
jgi:hypothetical protein